MWSISTIAQNAHQKIPVHIDPNQDIATIQSRNEGVDLPYHPFLENLSFVENDVLGKDALKHTRNIKTYDVLKNDKYIGTYTWSPQGVWYYLFTDQGILSIYPVEYTESNLHSVEIGMDRHDMGVCGGVDLEGLLREQMQSDARSPQDIHDQFGELIRTYRVAIVVTGEFYAQHGGNDNAVGAVVTSTIQGLNALYRRELSVGFTLVDWFDYGIGAPPFDSPDSGDRVNVARQAINANFNVNSYDIGHVLHYHPGSGDDWGSGGLASLNASCVSNGHSIDGLPVKAGGWSGSFNNNGPGWIALIGHEFGHQFGANHTFNGSGEVCSSSISEFTAYEIGSGTTIMSYNDLCEDNQNIPASPGGMDNYFHVGSLIQMKTHILSNDCASTISSTNAIPVVDANPCGATLQVPKQTYFYLKGSGSDDDNEELFYTWEQLNDDGPGSPTEGKVGTAAANDWRAPIFRSFPPQASSERYFPSLNAINAGGSDFEVVSNVPRMINMVLTARDYHNMGGGTDHADVMVEVVGTGPFAMQTVSNWSYGNDVTINWRTNGSNDLCDKVKIELSVDNGLSYNYLLAEDVDYGAESFTFNFQGLLPSSDNGKIKISCSDFECFYFFDISNRFLIDGQCGDEEIVVCPARDIEADFGSQILNTNVESVLGTLKNSYSKTVSENLPGGIINTYNNGQTGCAFLANWHRALQDFSVTEDGTYTFDVQNTSSVVVSVFEKSANGACSGFKGSSARVVGDQWGFSPIFQADLEACVEYTMVISKFSQLPYNVKINSISGPGDVYEITSDATSLVEYFIAVNKSNNLIAFVGENPDFRTLGKGEYTILAIHVGNSFDANTLLSQNFFEISSPECIVSSQNSFNITVNQDCVLTSAELGMQGDCDPTSNTFTQEIVVTYEGADMDDKIVVDGTQEFDITSSPQTIVITLPSDGGTSTPIVNLKSDSDCSYTLNVDHKDPCCPFDLELGEDQTACLGNTISLDAGDGGINGSYTWYLNETVISSETGRILMADAAGTYKVEVANADGCTESDEVSVSFSDPPVLELLGNTSYCTGSTTTINAETDGTYIIWKLNDVVIQEGTERSIDIGMSGELEVIAQFNPECSSSESITINEIDFVPVDLGDDVFKCEGESEEISVETNGEYTWYKDAVELSETSSALTINQSGTYVVRVSTDACVQTDTLEAFFETVPDLNAPASLQGCQGDSVRIDVETNSEVIRWYRETELLKEGSETFIEVSEAGTIRVEAGASANCLATANIIITLFDTPAPNLGDNIVACLGQSITLDANATGDNYRWKKDAVIIPNENESTLTVTESGIYEVLVSNGLCEGVSEVNVEFSDSPEVILDEMMNLCEGGTLEIVAQSSGTTFEWYFNGTLIDEATEMTYTTDMPGTYKVVASFDGSCPSEAETTVRQVSSPIFDLGNTKNACTGDETILTGPSGDLTYIWFKDDIQIGTTRGQAVTESGIYKLEVTNANMCTSEDEIEVVFFDYPSVTPERTTVNLCQGSVDFLRIETNGTNIKWKLNDVEIEGEIGEQLLINQGGSYTVSAENEIGCETVATIVVTQIELPAVELGDDRVECEGSDVTIAYDGTETNVTWYFNGNQIGSTPSVVISDAGNYRVVVENAFGCISEDIVNISFQPPPEVELIETFAICDGQPETITATTDGNVYQWYKDGVEIPGAIFTSLIVESEGVYSFASSNGENCNTTKAVTVTEFQTPVIELGDDQLLCPGNNITLDASFGSASSYTWSNGETSPSIVVNHEENGFTKTYSVTVVGEGNCTAEDEVTITAEPTAIAEIESKDSFVCTGDSLILKGVGGDRIEWSGPSGSYEEISNNSIAVFPSVDTSYTVSVSNSCPDNKDSATIRVEVKVPAEMMASPDTCMIEGKSIVISGIGGVDYQWNEDDSILDDLTDENIEVAPSEETTYTVTITDLNGCQVEDMVTVCIITDVEDIVKPITVITPNEDNMNEDLYFEGLELFTTNKLTIYNRWGIIVYEAEDYQLKGDLFHGYAGPDPLPADTYYYTLEFDDQLIKSTLTIIREKE